VNSEFDDAPDTSAVDLANMDPEERQKLEEHWRKELAKAITFGLTNNSAVDCFLLSFSYSNAKLLLTFSTD
jgi:hypothetical protein